MRIISNICRAVGAMADLLNFKFKRDERRAPEKAAQSIREAIAAGNEEAVNTQLEQARLKRKHGSVLFWVLAALFLVAVATLLGCQRTKLYVVPESRHADRMEVDGQAGWLVPEAMFLDLSEAYVRESHRAQVLESVEE